MGPGCGKRLWGAAALRRRRASTPSQLAPRLPVDVGGNEAQHIALADDVCDVPLWHRAVRRLLACGTWQAQEWRACGAG